MLIDHLKKESQGDIYSNLLQKDFDNVSCRIDDYLALDSYQRTQLIYCAWELLYKKKSLSIPFTTIKTLILADEDLFRNTGEYSQDQLTVSKRILEFAGTSIYTDRNRLFWFDNVVHTKKNRYLKVVTGNDLELFSGCTLVFKKGDDEETSDIVFENDLIAHPMTVRSLISSDEIELSEGRKQVGKLLKDWKIPPDRRWMIPVIEDRNGIAAVLGNAFGGSNRVAVRMRMVKDSIKIKNLIRVNVKYTGSYREYAE